VSPANEVSGPRSDKGRRTRASLIEAGKVVFARDGFLKARIVDIVAEAGASYGVFYHYFDSKETLFREIAEEVEVRLLSMDDVPHDRAAPVDPFERIREANRSYLTAYCQNAGIMRVIEEVSHYDEHVRAIRHRRQDEFGARQAASIRRLQRDGLADAEIEPRYAAMALSSMVVAFAAALCVSGAPYEFDQAVEQLTRLWVNALGLKNPK
jgi:AcrR family transcriptional regulator